MEILSTALRFSMFRSHYNIHRALVNYLINSRYEKKDNIFHLTFNEEHESYAQFKLDLFEDVNKINWIKETFNLYHQIEQVRFIEFKKGYIVFEFKIDSKLTKYLKTYMLPQRLQYLKFICNYKESLQGKTIVYSSNKEMHYFWRELFKIVILFYAFNRNTNNQQLSVDPKLFLEYIKPNSIVIEMFGSPINSFSLNRLAIKNYNNDLTITGKYEDLYPCYCSIDAENPFSLGDATKLKEHLESVEFNKKIRKDLVLMVNPPYTVPAITLAFKEIKKIVASSKINYKKLTIIFTCPYWTEEDHTKGLYKPVHDFFKKGEFHEKPFEYYDAYNHRYISSSNHKTAQWVLSINKTKSDD